MRARCWMTSLALLSAVSAAGAWPAMAAGDPPPAATTNQSGGWTVPVGARLQGLALFDGWTDPREVRGDVNAPGWTDSSYLLGTAKTGYELHYSYSRYDFQDRTFRHRLTEVGTRRAGQVYPAFNLFKATVKQGVWVSERLPFNPDGPFDYGAGGMAQGGSPYVFVRFAPKSAAGPPTAQIFEVFRNPAGRWGTPVRLPYPINTPCVQDNPTLSADGTTLYFDSNRQDPAGRVPRPPSGRPFNGSRTLFVSHLAGGRWSDPVAVEGAPNAAGSSNMQPFLSLDGSELYWTGFDRGSPAINCFYRARRDRSGGFGPAVLVAEPTPVGPAMNGQVVALGESSVSEDGQLLVFVFVRAWITGAGPPLLGPADRVEIGIALARRAKS